MKEPILWLLQLLLSGCWAKLVLDNLDHENVYNFIPSNSTEQRVEPLNDSDTIDNTSDDTDFFGNDVFLRISNHMKSQNATSGDDVQFKCKVAGRPKHNILYTWYHNDVKIDTGNNRHAHLSVTNHVWGSKLKIKGVYTFDSGSYRCEASNSYRRVHTSATLTISFKRPPPPSEKEKVTIKFPKGECQQYRGLVCSQYFNDSHIFVDPDAGQDEIENHIKSALHEIGENLLSAYEVTRANSNYISEKCRLFTLPAFCLYIFPPCSKKDESETSQPKRLCKEECEMLKHDICHKEYLERNNNVLMKYIFDNAYCDGLPSIKTSQCTSVGLYRQEQQKTEAISDCYHGNGDKYTGNINISQDGRSCKKWPNHLTVNYPELLGNHQFCRNLGGMMDKPWCYVDDEMEEKAPCDVTQCAHKEPFSLVFIIASCIGGILCIIVIAFTFCYCCRSKKKGHPVTSSSSILLHAEIPHFASQIKIPQLNASSVHLITEIGKWQHGIGYTGTIVDDGRFANVSSVAVKTLTGSSLPSQLEEFKNELEILSNLQHENVTELKAAVFQSSFHCLIFEHTTQVDLHEYLVLNRPNGHSSKKGLSEQWSPDNLDFLEMSLQIASGMEYLSSNNYIHRDLAARNVLVCGNMDLKISTLGVVRDSYLSCYETREGKPMPIKWMAPESLQCWQFSDKSTVWSFGVLLWEMFSYGLQPYCGYSNHEVLDVISRRQLLSCPDQCPAKIYSLMLECWNEQPTHRPGYKDICRKLRLWMEVGDVVIVKTNQVDKSLTSASRMADMPPPEYSSRPPSVANLRNGNCSHSECLFPTFTSSGTMTSEEQLMRDNENSLHSRNEYYSAKNENMGQLQGYR